MDKYFNMDSVSVVYPALGGHIFRVCAVFKEKIDINILKIALESISAEFPIVFTNLKKTFTGYVHVPATNIDVIEIGDRWITPPDLVNTDKPSFRIYVDEKILSIDFFHGNADGSMGNTFLAALVDAYCLSMEGAPLESCNQINDELLEDPYKMFYKKSDIKSLAEKKSFDLTFKTENYNYHRTACFNMKTDDIKNLIKNEGFTVNDFLCSVLYKAIYEGTDAKTSPYPVTISIGIDLRKRYNLDSHRNFIFFSNIRFNNIGTQNLNSIMQCFRKEINSSISKDNLQKGIASIALTANNPIVKFTPRVIKDYIIRKAYWFVSRKGITTTMSNIGIRKTNPICEKYVDRFEGYLGVIEGKMNVMAIGFGDNVSLCLTYNTKYKSVDNNIERILKECGIEFKVTEREYI